MALQVWLPLNGDTRQQGLSNITITGSPNAWNNGKIGKCAYWNGEVANVLYNNTTDLNYTDNFSVTFWANPVYTGSTAQYAWTVGRADYGEYGYGFQIISATTARFRFGNGSYSVSAPSNEWHHFVMTVGNSKVTIYKDGAQVSSNNLPGTLPTYGDGNGLGLGCFHHSGNIYPYYGSLNDFRIYNHCLSPMEVKQLSQGLVLHYPLNRQGWGQENLLKYTKVNATNQNLLKTNVTSSWNNLTLTTKDGYDCYLYPSAQSSTWFASGQWYTNMKANTTYTYTAWIYFTATANFTFTSLGHFQVYNSASTASDKAHEDVVSARIYQPSTIPANKWTKVRITFTTNDLANSYFVIYPRYNIAANTGDLYFRDCKLEESATPTPWCPHSVDNEYSTMGLNSTTEYDCSGFCNNGTRTGTFSWTSDTPKYQVSTAIEKGIVTSTNSFITTADPVFSVALWFKLKSNVTYTAYTDLISFSSSSYSNQPFRLEICGSPVGKSIMWFRGPSGQSGGFAVKSDLSFDTWYHTVLVSEGNKQYSYYINGEKLGTYNGSANSWTPTGNVSLGENISGVIYESDFRIYATALSADDVKSLYQNSAYIDSSGNVYGAVHSEV